MHFLITKDYTAYIINLFKFAIGPSLTEYFWMQKNVAGENMSVLQAFRNWEGKRLTFWNWNMSLMLFKSKTSILWVCRGITCFQCPAWVDDSGIRDSVFLWLRPQMSCCRTTTWARGWKSSHGFWAPSPTCRNWLPAAHAPSPFKSHSHAGSFHSARLHGEWAVHNPWNSAFLPSHAQWNQSRSVESRAFHISRQGLGQCSGHHWIRKTALEIHAQSSLEWSFLRSRDSFRKFKIWFTLPDFSVIISTCLRTAKSQLSIKQGNVSTRCEVVRNTFSVGLTPPISWITWINQQRIWPAGHKAACNNNGLYALCVQFKDKYLF